jgi:hypothetical protein
VEKHGTGNRQFKVEAKEVEKHRTDQEKAIQIRCKYKRCAITEWTKKRQCKQMEVKELERHGTDQERQSIPDANTV